MLLDDIRPVPSDTIGGALYVAFCLAAIPEATCKLITLAFYHGPRHWLDEPIDGLVYGAVLSLGFAAAENLYYVDPGHWHTALARALTSVPAHACFGAIVGYGFAKYKLGRMTFLAVLVAWCTSVLLHGLYDFPLLALRNLTRSGWFKAHPGAMSTALPWLLFGGCLIVLGITINIAVQELHAARMVQDQKSHDRQEFDGEIPVDEG